MCQSESFFTSYNIVTMFLSLGFLCKMAFHFVMYHLLLNIQVVAYFVLTENTALNIILHKSLRRSDLFPQNKFLEVELLNQRD